MKLLKSFLFSYIALISITLTGCGDDKNDIPYLGTNPPKKEEPTDTVAKPRYIWVDAAANFIDFANSKENIKRDLTLAKDAGFTDIVVDVRPISGDVLFKTDIEKQVEYLYAWISKDGGGSVYSRVYRTATWDYLQAFIDAGKELGLKIHAGFNTFSGGYNGSGLLYRDKEKAETWASTLNTASGFVNIMDIPGETTKFFNPSHPDVQNYLCCLLADLAKYDIDGIVLDRGRYLNICSDFSEISRQQFISFLGMNCNWPDDVLPFGSTSYPTPTPKYLPRWFEYRAKVIYEFMNNARNAVKSVNSSVKFGVYVGAWYSSYFDVGVNWAGKNYNSAIDYTWASPGYNNWGYAGLMDHMLLGAYANPNSVYGAIEWTIQGFCALGKKRTANECPLVVGGPDVGNWSVGGITETQELDAVKNSVDAAINACDGYFLFDMVHLKMNPKKWDYVKQGIDDYLKTVNN